MNRTEFPPRNLGSLSSNQTCKLFGWGENGVEIPRYESLRIYGPRFCNATLPRAFCTRFDLSFPDTCYAILGSPLVCGGEDNVSGFLVGSNRDCIRHEGLVELNFHSVGDFDEWIKKVSGAEKAAPISVLLILSAFAMTLKSMMS